VPWLISRALFQYSTLQQLDLRVNYFSRAGAAAIEESLERSLLRLELNWNVRFPEVLLTGQTRKHVFL
jgi:hypothetical protein